ncbi:radical SAM protein [bacterium]|nr:radical SAM protein [bacterium]
MMCHWPFTTLVVLSDLTAVCGCTDPDKRRPVGDLNNNSVSEVWNGPVLSGLRESFERGIAPQFCDGCFLKDVPTQSGCRRPLSDVAAGPQILQFEPCIRCNLRCPTPHCELNNNSQTRDKALASIDDFCRVFDQVGPNMEILRLYNYGESFLNPAATEMIAYARGRRPDIYIDAHTNGLVFTTDERRRQLVDCGLDYLVFSIDGASQESYARYRRGGDLSVVLDNLAAITKLRDQKSSTRLRICWRYILFNWNDSDDEMNRALEMAREIGVDQFTWHLNGADDALSSVRFRPGTPDFERIRHGVWDFGGWANALEEKIDSRYPSRLLAQIEPNVSQLVASPGSRISFLAKASNVGNTRWIAGDRQQRGVVRLGYHLFRGGEACGDVLFEGRGAAFESDVKAGDSVEVCVNLDAPRQPGEYVLRLDLVDEDIDWFTSFGSKSVCLPLIVQN